MLGLFKHRRVARLLSGYIDGQVSPAERRVIEDHLRTCDACSRDLDELRRTASLLGGLPELRPGRIYMLSSQPQTAPPRRPAFSLWAPGVAAAACAVLLVVVISGQAAGVLVQSGGFGEESESYADAQAAADAPELTAFDEPAEEDSALAGTVMREAASAGAEDAIKPEEQEVMEAAVLESDADVEAEAMEAMSFDDSSLTAEAVAEEAAFEDLAEMQEAEESQLMEAAVLESDADVEAAAMQAMASADDETESTFEVQADMAEVDDTDFQALSEPEDDAEVPEVMQEVAATLDGASVEGPAEAGSEGIELPLWQIQLAAGVALAVFAIASLVAGLVRRARR